MDRRDALKKLGAGSAMIVTSGLVRSSPAFAYDAPTQVTPPGVTLSGANPATVTITDGSASCPGSATSPAATFVSRSTDLSAVVSPIIFLGLSFPAVVNLVGVGVLPRSGVTLNAFNLQKQGATFGSLVAFAVNDRVTFTLNSTFRCTYSDGTTRDTVLTQTITRTYAGGGVWT